jgi:hypothetical protein
MTVLFFFLGLVFGYVSLALGPLGLIEALIVLGVALWQARRFPERIGSYLIGLSLVPVVVLGIIIARFPACDSRNATGQCYASITGPALAIYAIAGLIGAVVLGITLRRLFSTLVR